MSPNLVLLFVFCAVMAFILGMYIAIREWVNYRGRIRARMAVPSSASKNRATEISDIRQNRNPMGGDASLLAILDRLIKQSGTALGAQGVALAALGCAAAAYAAGFFADIELPLRILVAVACGTCLPVIALRAMREGRQRRFEDQLPDAIDTIVRSLKAGQTISTALSAVSKHMPDPIGAEFRLTASEMTYGLDLERAMLNLKARVGQADIGVLALAVTVQAKTGGNLAEILTSISRVIRDRHRLRRKARALASEARVSAYILSALPVFVFGMMWLLSPDYYGEVWNNPITKPILIGSFFWMLLGDYIIYRMARIRV